MYVSPDRTLRALSLLQPLGDIARPSRLILVYVAVVLILFDGHCASLDLGGESVRVACYSHKMYSELSKYVFKVRASCVVAAASWVLEILHYDAVELASPDRASHVVRHPLGWRSPPKF